MKTTAHAHASSLSVRNAGRRILRAPGLRVLLFALALPLSSAWAQTDAPAVLLTKAHAHNDYQHARPLLDALDCGFCSVEADIWLVEGQLLVAHDRSAVRDDRTLQSLYLAPLLERVEKNGGRVFAHGPTVTLLIDFKSGAAETYPVLLAALKPYEKILTVFHPDRTETNAVTIILSGNSPRDALRAQSVRLAGYDGRPNELDASVSPHLMPLVSDSWKKQFAWRGKGPLPTDERAKLKTLVDKSHRQGMRLRFWSAPDSPDGWTVLLDGGVDVISTDNLSGFRDYFTARPQP